MFIFRLLCSQFALFYDPEGDVRWFLCVQPRGIPQCTSPPLLSMNPPPHSLTAATPVWERAIDTERDKREREKEGSSHYFHGHSCFPGRVFMPTSVFYEPCWVPRSVRQEPHQASWPLLVQPKVVLLDPHFVGRGVGVMTPSGPLTTTLSPSLPPPPPPTPSLSFYG